MTTAAEFIDAARRMVGTPWLHQGRTPAGVDCIGMVLESSRNAGLDLIAHLGIEDPKGYGRNPSPELLARVEQYGIPIDKPVPGCVIFFQFPSEKRPRHFAIYTERGTMIHADSRRGKVVEHGYRALWVKWTHSLWLVPGIDYE